MENIPFRPKNDTFESLSDIISNLCIILMSNKIISKLGKDIYTC